MMGGRVFSHESKSDLCCIYFMSIPSEKMQQMLLNLRVSTLIFGIDCH